MVAIRLRPLLRQAERFLRDATVTACERDQARANELADPVRPEEIRHRLELVRRARRLDREGPGSNVDDLRAEDVGDLYDLRACVGGRLHLDEQELALDGAVLLELDD